MHALVQECLLERRSNRGLMSVLSYSVITFPEALRPVNQIVAPFWPKSSDRSSNVTAPGWNVMFVAIVSDEVVERCGL